MGEIDLETGIRGERKVEIDICLKPEIVQLMTVDDFASSDKLVLTIGGADGLFNLLHDISGRIKAYLSSILAQAVDDVMPMNPASMTGKLIKKKDGREEIKPFTWEEKMKFEEAMKEHYPRYYPLYLTALRTGMRMGEMIALQPGDLDFNGLFIEVRRNYVRGRITTPKTGRPRRVDMSDGLAEVLKEHLTERKKESLKKGWGTPSEWLFYNESGNLLNVSNLRNRVFVKCLEKAGLSHRRQHDLRHTYATLRIAKGDNVLDVSRQLGHHSVKMTLDVYAHWLPGEKKAEVNELDFEAAPVRTLSAPNPPIKQKKDSPESAKSLI